MNLRLAIGGEELRIDAACCVLAAMSQRYGCFTVAEDRHQPGRSPIRIEVRERVGGFRPAYERPEEGVVVRCVGDLLSMEGSARGAYDVAARRGWVEDVTGLGSVDALVRLVLSASLPLGGGLLLHAAAVRRSANEGLALCGASGSGKSTAAEFFGAACDELVVLRPEATSVEILSTPYWKGLPFRAPCRKVVCLVRGEAPHLRVLRGAEAVRALARHVIRYVPLQHVERAILRLVGEICSRLGVTVAECPEGPAFVPFLARGLALEEAS